MLNNCDCCKLLSNKKKIYCKLVDLCKKHPHLVDDSEIKLSKRVGGQFKKRVKFRGKSINAVLSIRFEIT